MNIQEIEQKLKKQKRRIGLVGGGLKVKEYDESEHNFSAHINPNGWDIEISLRKGYNPLQRSRARAYARLKKIKEDEGLERMLSDVGVSHECAHWELAVNSGYGCPYDPYNHDKILEAIKTALPKDKKDLTSYVANAFEDMIINPRCKEFNRDHSGQVLFWDSEGLLTREKGEKHFSPFYEAFVKLNLHLWGDKLDYSLLKEYFSNDQKVDNAVKKVIDNLELAENIPSSEEGTSPLFVKDRWPQMASAFARDLAELLDHNPDERLSAYSPQQNEEESGDKKDQKSVRDTMNRLNNRIKEVIGTDDALLSWKNKSICRNF